MNNDTNVGVKIEALTSTVEKGLGNVNKRLNEMEKSTKNFGDAAEKAGDKAKKAFDFKDALAWIKTIQKVTDGMIRITKAQADYNKSMQKLQIAYGSINSSGEKLVKTMADLSGLDIAQLTSSLGTFRQFASSLGLANEQASLLSENMLKMVNDLSSFYGYDVDEMSKKLISALTGETEAMKILGADVSDNAIKQKALALGIETSTANMSMAEKATLRYLLVVDQLRNSQGNFAATINDVSNQTKIWNAQIDTLKRQLGAGILPILQTILPVLNGILMVVNTLLGMLLGFMGIDIGFDDLVVNSGQFADNIESAGTAAKNAQKSLRGFDKLNVVRTPTKASGTGTGVGGVDSRILAQMDEYNDKLKEAHNKAVEIRDTIMEWLGFGKDANGEWHFMGVTFGTIAGAAGIIGIVVLSILKVIKGIKGIKGIISKIFSFGGVSGGKGGDSGSSFKLPSFKTIIKGLGELALIVTATGIYVGAVGALIQKYPNLKEILSEGTDALVDLFIGIAKILIPLAGLTGLSYLAGQGKGIMKGLGELAVIVGGTGILIAAIGELMRIPGATEVVSTGVDTVVKIFDGVSKIIVPLALLTGLSFLTGSAGVVVLEGIGILAVIILALTAFFEAMGAIMEIAPGEELIEKGINIICKVFEGIGRIVGSLVGGVVEGVVDTISNVLPNLGTKLSEFANNSKDFFDTINNIDESAALGAKYVAQALLYITAANVLSGISGMAGILGAVENLKILPAFGTAMKEFQENLGKNFDADFVKSAASAAMALTEVVNNLPPSGGKIQKVIGTKDLATFSAALPDFGKNMKSFSDNVNGINPELVETSASAAKALTEVVNNLPNTDGAWQKIFGGKNLATFSSQLPAFGENVKSYYDYVSKIDVGKMNTITEGVNKLIDVFKSASESKSTSAINNFATALGSAANSISKMFTSTFSWNEGNNIGWSFGNGMGNGIRNGIKNITLPSIKLQNARGQTEQTFKLKAYAQGGFPEDGIFLANHKELVGTFSNGKTAVANNDQIVDGISAGVAKAIMATGRNVNINITAEGDTQGLLDFIEFKQKQKDRQYGF